MPRGGWTTGGLPAVGDNPLLWTVEDAATVLGPPELTAAQVRHLVRIAAVAPVGLRQVRKNGRSSRVYPAGSLIQAYDALYRLHTKTAAPEGGCRNQVSTPDA
jgi:hypothetical protein